MRAAAAPTHRQIRAPHPDSRVRQQGGESEVEKLHARTRRKARADERPARGTRRATAEHVHTEQLTHEAAERQPNPAVRLELPELAELVERHLLDDDRVERHADEKLTDDGRKDERRERLHGRQLHGDRDHERRLGGECEHEVWQPPATAKGYGVRQEGDGDFELPGEAHQRAEERSLRGRRDEQHRESVHLQRRIRHCVAHAAKEHGERQNYRRHAGARLTPS